MIEPEDLSERSTSVDVLFQLYTAINRGNTETAAELIAETATWTEPADAGEAVGSSDARGPEAIIENVFAPTLENVATIQLVPTRVLEAEDCTIVEGAFLGTAVDGSAFDVPFAHVFELADGTVRRVTSYEDPTAPRRELESATVRRIR